MKNTGKNGIKKSTMRVAMCSVIAALSLTLMLITSLVPVGTYALPCAAGALLVCVVVEYGIGWALGVFGVTAVLSAFLAGDKEAVIYFIALFGYYPMLKQVIESRVKLRAVQYVIKLAVFNAAAVGSFFVAMWLLSLPASEFTISGFYVPWAFLAVGNVFFVIYDFALTGFVTQYVRRLRGKIFKQ